MRFHDDAGELALGLVFVSMLLAVTLTDLERRIIPNKILLVGSVIGLAIVAISDPASVPERLAAGSRGRGRACSSPRSPIPAAWGWGT